MLAGQRGMKCEKKFDPTVSSARCRGWFTAEWVPPTLQTKMAPTRSIGRTQKIFFVCTNRGVSRSFPNSCWCLLLNLDRQFFRWWFPWLGIKAGSASPRPAYRLGLESLDMRTTVKTTIYSGCETHQNKRESSSCILPPRARLFRWSNYFWVSYIIKSRERNHGKHLFTIFTNLFFNVQWKC